VLRRSRRARIQERNTPSKPLGKNLETPFTRFGVFAY
jgi:hypothetical protein